MNKKNLITISAASFIALVVGLLIGRLTGPTADTGTPMQAVPAAQESTQWTCSMHPNILQPEPGDCPICGMDLIPLESGGEQDLGPRAMSMTESSMALANIQTTTVQRDFPSASIDLVGRLEYDETQVKSLTARFPARIEHLFVNYTGVAVNKDEHLAIVYSPELLTAQRELLTAHKADPNSSTTRAAREKLRLWDLLPDQIDAILQIGEASDRFELRAPVSGIVVAKNVNEGDYLTTGKSLFKIVDLSNLWLFLDAYESDLPWLRYGQEVTFSVEALPGETFTGQIAFIEPEFDRKSRTVPVRVNVPNKDGRLKPGMFARGTVMTKVASGGKVYEPDLAGKWISPMHPEIIKNEPGQCDVCGMDLVTAESLGYVSNNEGQAPLVVPASAVLRTGKRAIVYVQLPEREQPTFEGREVTLGLRAGDVFIIRDGLSEGENVVTNGAFKIDSALQIQAKPSMMSPDGGAVSSHAGHGSSGTMPGESNVSKIPLQIETAMAAAILMDYFNLQNSMAMDNFDKSRQSLTAMMEKTGHSGPLPDLIHVMLASESMEALRRPHFETLSNALISAVKAEPDKFAGDVYLLHCPMVYPDRGADWLQPDNNLLNPYFGEMMLTCGVVKTNLTASENKHSGHDH